MIIIVIAIRSSNNNNNDNNNNNRGSHAMEAPTNRRKGVLQESWRFLLGQARLPKYNVGICASCACLPENAQSMTRSESVRRREDEE